MGRKSFNISFKRLTVYLRQEQLSDINSLVGEQFRSSFIREAVDLKIKRDKKKLENIQEKTNIND